jgi:hypothetical protein
MQPQSNLLTWLVEFSQRLKQKSPAFFSVLSQVNTVILLVAGLPTIFTELISWGVLPVDWQNMIPERWIKVLLRIISFCAAYGLLISKLTVLRPPVQVQNDGTVLNVTEPQKLPFTAKKEAEVVNGPKPDKIIN